MRKECSDRYLKSSLSAIGHDSNFSIDFLIDSMGYGTIIAQDSLMKYFLRPQNLISFDRLDTHLLLSSNYRDKDFVIHSFDVLHKILVL